MRAFLHTLDQAKATRHWCSVRPEGASRAARGAYSCASDRWGNLRFPVITLKAVLSQAPTILAPVRRFSFAGEQQDSDTTIRIVRRLLTGKDFPKRLLSFSASVIPALHQNKTSCSESVSGIGAAKKSHHFVQSCNIECRHRASVFQPFPHGRGRIEQLELDAVVASPLLQIHEHA